MIKYMDKRTITRLILAAIGLINIAIVAVGLDAIAISEDIAYKIASVIYLVASCGWAIYKNNPTSAFGHLCVKIKEACKQHGIAEVVEGILVFLCDNFPEENKPEEDENK